MNYQQAIRKSQVKEDNGVRMKLRELRERHMGVSKILQRSPK